jgi:hypothetical protein
MSPIGLFYQPSHEDIAAIATGSPAANAFTAMPTAFGAVTPLSARVVLMISSSSLVGNCAMACSREFPLCFDPLDNIRDQDAPRFAVLVHAQKSVPYGRIDHAAMHIKHVGDALRAARNREQRRDRVAEPCRKSFRAADAARAAPLRSTMIERGHRPHVAFPMARVVRRCLRM